MISKSQNIIIIPFSLCLLTAFSVYGPQGAFSTSERSQVNELKHLFEKYKSLEGDKLIALKINPSKEDMSRMINVVDYLVNMHGLESFNPILKRDLETVRDSLYALATEKKYDSRTSRWEIKSKQKRWLYTYLNLQSDDLSSSEQNLGINMVEAFNVDILPLNKAADYMFPLNLSREDTLSNIIESNKLLISRIKNQNKFKVIYKSEIKYILLDTLINQMDSEFKQQKLSDKQVLQVSRKLLSQELDFGGMKLQVLWNRLTFNDNKDLLSADAYVLLSLKN